MKDLANSLVERTRSGAIRYELVMRIHGSVKPAAASAVGSSQADEPYRSTVESATSSISPVGRTTCSRNRFHQSTVKSWPSSTRTASNRRAKPASNTARVLRTVFTGHVPRSGSGDDDACLSGVVDDPRAERVETGARHAGRIRPVLGTSLDDEASEVAGEREVETQHEHALALGGQPRCTGGQRERLTASGRAGHPTNRCMSGVRGNLAGLVAQLHRPNGVVYHAVDDELTVQPPDRRCRCRHRRWTFDEERQPVRQIVARPDEHRVGRVAEAGRKELPRFGPRAPGQHHDRPDGAPRIASIAWEGEELLVQGAAMAPSDRKGLFGTRFPSAAGTEHLDVTAVAATMIGGTPVDDVDGDRTADVVGEHEVRDVLAELGSDVDRPVVTQLGERLDDRTFGLTEGIEELIEMVDGRSDDGHGGAPFEQADAVSSASTSCDLRSFCHEAGTTITSRRA
jgi:hypothetical protein